MKLTPCDASHLPAILEIFNDAIATSTALYDYAPRTPAMMETWFEAKQKGRYPVMGAVSEQGQLMGFCTYGPFRAFPAYKYTVEHSVYVAREFRGRGLGKTLLAEVIRSAEERDYHLLIGCIDSGNAVSIRLHEAFGFQHAGTIREAGFKFGRWLDIVFYQRILSTPAQPTSG